MGCYHIHRTKGTPLLVAVSSANFVVVDALLESSSWQPDIARIVEVEESDGSSRRLTAPEVAVEKVLRSISTLESAESISVEDIEGLERHSAMMEKLIRYYTHHTNGKGYDFASMIPWVSQRIANLLSSRRLVHLQHMSLNEGEHDGPIDLSVMNEEKPTKWVEGTAMNAEQATRTMLKFFRTRKDSIEEVMDTAYNTRNRG